MDRKTLGQNNSFPMLQGHLTEKTHHIKKMYFTERLHIEISVKPAATAQIPRKFRGQITYSSTIGYHLFNYRACLCIIKSKRKVAINGSHKGECKWAGSSQAGTPRLDCANGKK